MGIHGAAETHHTRRPIIRTHVRAHRLHNRQPHSAMSGPPQPPRGGLSLYADLLEPSTDSPATISSAPVLYNEAEEQQPAKNPGQPPPFHPHVPYPNPLTHPQPSASNPSAAPKQSKSPSPPSQRRSPSPPPRRPPPRPRAPSQIGPRARRTSGATAPRPPRNGSAGAARRRRSGTRSGPRRTGTSCMTPRGRRMWRST